MPTSSIKPVSEGSEEQGNGPKRDRSITDCFFCLLMLAFWGGCVFVAIYSFSRGNPWKLMNAYDLDNRICGQGDLEAYPIAYFHQPLTNLAGIVCVKSCPTWVDGGVAPPTVDCAPGGPVFTQEVGVCASSPPMNFSSASDLVWGLNERFLIYNSTSLLGRVCVPYAEGATQLAMNYISNLTTAAIGDSATQHIEDLAKCWRQMLYVAGVAFVVSIITFIILRFLAGVLIWILILLFLAAIFGGGVYAHLEANRLDKLDQSEQTSGLFSAKNLRIMAYVAYALGGIALIILLCSLPSIAIAVAVLKSACLYVASNFHMILVPVVMAVFCLIWVLFWATVLAYLWTIGDMKKGDYTPFATFVWEPVTKGLMVLHAFFFFFYAAFLLYLGVFITAAHCSIWYFNSGSGQFVFPLKSAIYWSFRYHLGSIAFGAFILALVWVIKLILIYLVNYVENLKKKGVENKVLSCFLKCLLCFVSCFERFVKFVSELGFAQVAITSKNFCVSCLEAMTLVVSNPMKFGLLHLVGNIISMIGKLFVAAGTGFIGFLIISNDPSVKDSLNSKVLPTIIFVIIGYSVASVFFSLYGITADTIILCFFADKKLAESGGRPVNAPAPMAEFYEAYAVKK